jgi:chromosome segregation ATPase
MTAAATHDLDGIEQGITERLGELREQRQRLSLDALTNSKAAKELEDVEGRIVGVQAELDRVGLARAERERRELDARQAEVDDRQRAAMTAARELQVDREKAAKAVDRATNAYVDAIASYFEVCRAQQAKLVAAGAPQLAHIARPFGFAIEAAFARAKASDPRVRGADVFSQPAIPPGHQKPLAEGDPKPVEPAGSR